MRVAKASYLRRLLKMQDALLVAALYLLIVTIMQSWSMLSAAEFLSHAKLTVLVGIAGVVASANAPAKLHSQSILTLLWFCLRYTLIVCGVILTLDAVGPMPLFDRQVLQAFVVLLFLGLLANRLFLRWWYLGGRAEHPENFLKVLVIGIGPRARRLVAAYRDSSEWEIEIVGMLDPLANDGPDTVDGVPAYRGEHHIKRLLATEVVDEVVVCLPRSLINEIGDIVEECKVQGICLRFMADLYDLGSEQVSLQHLGGIPMITLEPIAHDESKLFCKRLMDVVVSGVALLLAAPLLLLVAVLIKLDSPGPVFFVQRRMGLNKRSFNMIKFRSMRQDAEAVMAELEHLNEASGPIFKMDHDPRVTRLGHWLRKSSIDELPQLVNVFCGQMSLVGPRPLSLRDVGKFNLAIQLRRFSVRPGLACLREVSGRSKLSFDRWLELDLEYIERWSLWLDVKIMLKLIPVVLRGEGAT